MPVPMLENLELPLLKVMSDAGGKIRRITAMERMKSYYPALGSEDLKQLTSSGKNMYNHRVDWARRFLLVRGELDDTERGIWNITDVGRTRLEKEWSSWTPKYSSPVKQDVIIRDSIRAQLSSPQEMMMKPQDEPFKDSARSQESSIAESLQGDPEERIRQAQDEIANRVEQQLLQRLRAVEPSIFEVIIASLLERLEYGSISDGSIRVTGRTGDGGIDGECSLDVLGLFDVKFQAKRWAQGHPVTGPEMRSFIGSLSVTRSGHGIFVTTSDFTKDAIESAQRSGIVRLVNGTQLVRIMANSGLGVRKSSIEIITEIDEDFFEGLSDNR